MHKRDLLGQIISFFFKDADVLLPRIAGRLASRRHQGGRPAGTPAERHAAAPRRRRGKRRRAPRRTTDAARRPAGRCGGGRRRTGARVRPPEAGVGPVPPEAGLRPAGIRSCLRFKTHHGGTEDTEKRMKDGLRSPSSLIFYPLSLISHPSSFIPHPSYLPPCLRGEISLSW